MASLPTRTAAQGKADAQPHRIRVVCVSDTHELHRELTVPDGDLLIHAGDFTFFNSISKIRDFNDWLGELPHSYKVVIPGNHDRAFNKDPRNHELITNSVLLINDGVRVCGLNIWGSPVTCDDAAYGHTKPEERASLYATIPADTDILITHGPPLGIRDHERGSNERRGCPQLREAVLRVKPRLHVFGHVHGGYRRCRLRIDCCHRCEWCCSRCSRRRCSGRCSLRRLHGAALMDIRGGLSLRESSSHLARYCCVFS